MASYGRASAEAATSATSNSMLEPGETSLLQRGNIKGTFYGSGMSTVNTRGTAFLTTRRIIFVPKRVSRGQRQFYEERGQVVSIRLSEIVKHRFNQPLFGANSIYVRVPHTDPQIEFMKCKLGFYSGGVGTFLAAFLRLMRSRQAVATHGGVAVAEVRPMVMQAEAEVAGATAIRGAPRNPNDPTTVWISDAIVVDTVFEYGTPAPSHASADGAATARVVN